MRFSKSLLDCKMMSVYTVGMHVVSRTPDQIQLRRPKVSKVRHAIRFYIALALVSGCVAYGPAKSGLRFCVGATVVSCHLDVSRCVLMR